MALFAVVLYPIYDGRHELEQSEGDLGKFHKEEEGLTRREAMGIFEMAEFDPGT